MLGEHGPDALFARRAAARSAAADRTAAAAITTASSPWRGARNLTIRQLGSRVAGARGKNVFVGTPAQVADYMEEWFVKGACDGFT